MPYVTSIERLAKEVGREEGREEGQEKGILIGQILVLQRQLDTQAVAKSDLQLMSFSELSDTLEQLLKKAETFKQE